MTYTIANQDLTVTVSEDGAELQGIRDAAGTEYLWSGDAAYWCDCAPNLFPYVARLPEGKYTLGGEEHHMRIHGIAPYRRFRRIEHDAARMVFELRSDAETLAEYPREFAFRIIYALAGKHLNVTFEVENLDARTMYFGLGGHPGFRVPLTEGKRFEDYCLRFAEPCSPKRVGFTPDCFVTGEDTEYALANGTDIPLHHDLFDDDAIVLRDMAREVTLCSDDVHAVTVRYPQMRYLGIWHMPKTDAPYVCIEPWLSLPAHAGRKAVLEEQEDLVALAPGETYRNLWSIEIHNS